jgi:hypothetical protein
MSAHFFMAKRVNLRRKGCGDMRSNKRFYFGLIAGFALITSLASFFLAITPQKAYAVDPALFAEANKICKQIHYTDKDPQLATCRIGYLGQKGGKTLNQTCVGANVEPGCSDGWNAANDSISTNPAEAEKRRKANDFCYQEQGDKRTSCIAGYLAALNKQSIIDACSKAANKEACTHAFNGATAQEKLNAPGQAAKDACKDYAPGGDKANNTYYNNCLTAFADGKNGLSKDASCGSVYFVDGSDSQKSCLAGWEASQGAPDDSCETRAKGLPGFETSWLICTLLRGMGGLGDGLNDAINNQLEFNINQNLNSNVKAAWNIFRVLSTIMLVVIMLIMVLSQAIGGPFEAYTVRKLLPKILISIILIQLSWYISKYAITLANDFGKGIQELLAAPFGGLDNLKLDKLVSNLGGSSTGTAGVGIVAVIFTLIAVTAFNPFGAFPLDRWYDSNWPYLRLDSWRG